MSLSLRAALVAAFLAAAVVPAAAQSVAPAPEPSATPLPEIGRVFTSDRHDEPLDRTPRPTYVVDRARMEARGDRTIAEALAGVPGIDVFSYGGVGAQSSVFLRGTTSSAQVLFLLDGVPIAPASNGEIDPGSFSTAGVRRIEIVEGTGSTLYGSSAIGGVINIITAVPRETYLAAASGASGERDLRVEAGNGRLGVAVERRVARNDFPYPATAAFPAAIRRNADAQQTAARISYDARLGSVALRLRLGSDAIAIGVPGDLAFGPTPSARQRTSHDDLRLELAHGGKQSTTSLTLGASRQLLDYLDPTAGPVNDTNDGRVSLSLRNVVSGAHGALTAGIDLSRESAVITNVPLYDPATFALLGYVSTGRAQAESAAYAQYQWFAGSLRAYAGLRGERDAPVASVVTPSAGIALDAGRFRVAANAGGAFRVPTLVDLDYPGYANPDLKPERASDLDLTVATRGGAAAASLGWFAREATNLIQADPNANFVPRNIARASIRGLQATLRSAPSHGVVASVAVTDLYRALDVTPGIAASRLNFEPVFTVTMGIEKLLGPGDRFAFGAHAAVIGPHAEGGVLNADVPATVDAYVRERLAPRTVLSLRARNLGNERFSPVVGYPAPGRRFELELATR